LSWKDLDLVQKGEQLQFWNLGLQLQ
jgi:hypothetical protein